LTDALTFSVRGTPRPKARPRFIRGRAVSTVSKSEKLWNTALDRAARLAMENRGAGSPLFRGAVRVRMVFTFTKSSRADTDNLAKGPMDRMTRAGIWQDDSQVASLEVEKQVGTPVGLVVLVEPMEKKEARRSPVEDAAPDWLV
jgi:Holliday junction resolvase RusA-like endonuclease